MKKRIIALAAALAFALSMAGCGGGPGQGEGAAEPSTLVYGSGDYTRINPAMDEHGEINSLLFNGLTTHDGENRVAPCLAKSWEFEEETCSYTFFLEEGVVWHDGKDFTAEDVKFTIESIMDPENGSENAPNYEDVEEISVVDEHTITFRLSAPNAAFLDYMAMAVLPRHLLEGEDMQTSDFFRAPVGTGPYKLCSWDTGQAITLEKNQEYFKGAPKIDQIVFKIIADDSVKALQLRSGELDLAQVTPKDAQTFASSREFALYDMKTSDYRGILYNFQNPYWQENGDLIPAINYAIDRQAILDSVLLGCGEVAYSPLQRNVYNREDIQRFSYDPQKAEALLREAGCEKGEDGFYYRNGEKLGFTLNATPGDQVRVDMAQIAAQQLRAVGLDVTANVPPEGIDWGAQEACVIGWGSPFDADDHTYKVFGTGKGANYSGYSNELVDQYLTEARQTSDESVRARAYGDFLEELTRRPPYTFFCYIDAMYVAKNSVKGIAPDTVLGHHGVGIFWNVTEWTMEE